VVVAAVDGLVKYLDGVQYVAVVPEDDEVPDFGDVCVDYPPSAVVQDIWYMRSNNTSTNHMPVKPLATRSTTLWGSCPSTTDTDF
jgi:hypothetical protein